MCSGGVAEVALDSSALSDLLDHGFDLERTVSAVRKANVRLVLVEFALGECAQGHAVKARERYQRLWQLHERLYPARFGVAIGLRALIRREQQGHTFASTPMPMEATYWQYAMKRASEDRTWFEENQSDLAVRAAAVMRKDEWRERDKSMQRLPLEERM